MQKKNTKHNHGSVTYTNSLSLMQFFFASHVWHVVLTKNLAKNSSMQWGQRWPLREPSVRFRIYVQSRGGDSILLHRVMQYITRASDKTFFNNAWETVNKIFNVNWSISRITWGNFWSQYFSVFENLLTKMKK